MAFTNGEANLAFYGGRLTGPATALPVPSGYTAAYDTGTVGITVGLASRNLGPIAGSTGDQSVTGPAARWVAQQVLLRPQYDSSLLRTTPAGTMTYDKLNRLTGTSSGHAYSYDGVGNRLAHTLGSQAVSYAYNNANQLTNATSTISLVGTGTGQSSSTASPFTVNLLAGIQAGDQILVAVEQTAADTVSVAGYTEVSVAVSGSAVADATTVLYRRTATGGETQLSITGSTVGGPAATVQTAAAAVYRGVDPVDPVDALSKAGTRLASVLTVPSLTPGVAGERLVVVQGAADNGPPGTWTPPAGMTERVQNTAQLLRSVGIADQTLTSTAATGPLSSTLATTGGAGANLAGIAVTLRPQAPAYTYDGNGNLTAVSGGGTLAYDTADRTTAITPPGGTTINATYRGDTQAERATMSPVTRVNAACTVIGGCTPQPTTLGSTAAFEHTALGVSAETIGSATTYYVRDPQGGLLAQRTGGNTYYYRFDGQGSITGLLNPSGSVAATYDYDPFGQLTAVTGGTIATNNPWRYVGAYQDGTGLYKMGARYYDPSLGRWTQQDPIHDPLDPKQWNRYVYVGNDPVNYTDLTGTNAFSDFFTKTIPCVAKKFAKTVAAPAILIGAFAGEVLEAISAVIARGTVGEVIAVSLVGGAVVIVGVAGVVVLTIKSARGC